ncbi:hypothetical protein FMUND_1645 [Fusarium mundagurra]|uniref:Uncharacterized protein n=1 Tax=Fusarium mundagurra TaxID=1567541 RepID=A0A8H5Z3T0_9HYPO|nr:hypothetical protein FMUND_1645 [Fusarium mundagurra]
MNVHQPRHRFMVSNRSLPSRIAEMLKEGFRRSDDVGDLTIVKSMELPYIMGKRYPSQDLYKNKFALK